MRVFGARKTATYKYNTPRNIYKIIEIIWAIDKKIAYLITQSCNLLLIYYNFYRKSYLRMSIWWFQNESSCGISYYFVSFWKGNTVKNIKILYLERKYSNVKTLKIVFFNTMM